MPIIFNERAKKVKSSPLKLVFNRISLVLSVIFSINLILIVYLNQCAKLVNYQYKSCQLKEIKDTLERQNNILQVKEENLSNFERIEKLAKVKLGMVMPVNRIVLNLSSSVLQASRVPYFALDKFSKR